MTHLTSVQSAFMLATAVNSAVLLFSAMAAIRIASARLRGWGAVFLDAMHRSRARQAAAIIRSHAHLLDGGHSRASAAEARHELPSLGDGDDAALFPSHLGASDGRMICPITAHPCDGDRSFVCEEFGCARKGGLSPSCCDAF
jgi:hypothetical protein